MNVLAKSAPLTVYFDGEYLVCSAEIAHYRRQRGSQACKWVDAAVCTDAQFGPGLTHVSALRRLHVRGADGRLVDGMRGFAALWRLLPKYAARQMCVSCALHRGKAADPTGACPLFADKQVNAKGWCSAWVKKG